ncbi:MAG: hypothetical protein PHU97_08410 [Bacteroidales bacterium]|nr:hypothetical protein [Bacteroidales bacterium]MDD3011324.1 hypothetical protein [Bacteroidales bacterium]MDD3962152.1 hypothetical protein [Bacteroidales bacterium]
MFPLTIAELIYGWYSKKNPIPETDSLQENQDLKSLKQETSSKKTVINLALVMAIVAIAVYIIIKRKK